MQTYRYLVPKRLNPYESHPHFGTPGVAFVKRRWIDKKNMDWNSEGDDIFWNKKFHRKWGKATSGFILVEVFWDRFKPGFKSPGFVSHRFIRTFSDRINPIQK